MEALSIQGNITQEKFLTALRQRENQRTTASRIRALRDKLRNGSNTIVTVTEEAGYKVDLTDRKSIEKAILHNNTEKFSQSFHTVLYNSPLKEKFGFKGLTTASQSVLAGSYDDTNLDPYIKEILHQWQMP